MIYVDKRLCKATYLPPDGAIYIYSVRILRKGLRLFSDVQLVYENDAPPLRCAPLRGEEGEISILKFRILLVLGRVYIVLMETSFL